MDRPQYSTVLDALAVIPDPRVSASALLRQQRSAAAMAHCAHAHAEALVAALRPHRRRVPSEATIRRALRQVDIRHLEAHLARLRVRPGRAPTPAKGRAVQG
jgi:endonuclease/exonuclease/phosphatase (EEP) superfamily protein YafD